MIGELGADYFSSVLPVAGINTERKQMNPHGSITGVITKMLICLIMGWPVDGTRFSFLKGRKDSLVLDSRACRAY